MDKVNFLSTDTNLMLKIAEDMHQLASSIEALCNLPMSELNKDAKTEEPKQESKKSKVTLEKVRGVLADKSQAGYTAEVKAIIQSHGVNRLSEIAQEDYEVVLKEAETIGND